jgi:hypothetical protein
MNPLPPEPTLGACDDCGGREKLLMVAADLGQGAFLAILCETCWHRRQYRAELIKRKVNL